jgi:hypothetical protein
MPLNANVYPLKPDGLRPRILGGSDFRDSYESRRSELAGAGFYCDLCDRGSVVTVVLCHRLFFLGLQGFGRKTADGEAAMILQQDLSKREEQVAEARLWIRECRWQDEPEALAELTDAEVIRGIDQHYQGGWSRFCRDIEGYYITELQPS